MRHTPVLFSAPMALANVQGRKTETRRGANLQVINEHPDGWVITGQRYCEMDNGDTHMDYDLTKDGKTVTVRFPYGFIGDIIYQREAIERKNGLWHYAADGVAIPGTENYKENKNKIPSLFMPSAFSRWSGEITGVRLERVQDITEEAAIAEGIEVVDGKYRNYLNDKISGCKDARVSWMTLAASINGAEWWERNEWCWVMKYGTIKKG